MENKKINTKKRWFILAAVNILPLIAVVAVFAVKNRIEVSGGTFAVCMMHDFLHLYCPACGGTRAVRALLSFDFMTALRCNPTVLLLFIYFVYYDIYAVVAIIKKRDKVIERIHPFVLISLLLVFIGYGILRNVFLVYFNIDFIGDFR